MRTLIIDDELEARETLCSALASFCPALDIVGTASNGREGLNLINLYRPELVLLDVEMPDMNGFEVLESLDEVDFALIFVTAYNEYAVKAFDFSAVDYLLKPVEPSRLIHAVERVKQRRDLFQAKEQYDLLLETVRSKDHTVPNKRVTFRTQEEIVFAELRDLIRIEADENCCSVYVLGLQKKVFIAKHLKFYERLFREIPFIFRVHRSHIVNLYYVKKFLREDGGYLLLTGHPDTQSYERVPISNRLRDEILRRLEEL